MLKTKAGDIIGTPGPDAYTIPAFCKAHGISVSTLYNLMQRGICAASDKTMFA